MLAGFSVDIELTNRCNAKCHFCPRDQTPHQGVMKPEVFAKSLERAVEFQTAFPDRSVIVNLCGLGEPLINSHAADFVRDVRAAGFLCGMSTNASLLDERRGRALLDAGLQKVHINAGNRDEAYEDVYGLPFERTRQNVARFVEMAGDECEVEIILVDYLRDKEHLRKMQEYWRAQGVKRFMAFSVINRGGALFVDHMQYESYPEVEEARAMLEVKSSAPVCAAPFVFLFIGYDGQYYLCCSDWKKEVPLGSVFDVSFLEIGRQKLQYVSSRDPICKTCNHDPTNQLIDQLRNAKSGDPDEESTELLIQQLQNGNAVVQEVLEQMEVASTNLAGPAGKATKRRIPLIVR